MDRGTFIERTLRQIYNGQPADDATITVNLVNTWLNDAIAVAAKKNYTDSIALDGIAYINNSFYTTYKGLALASDEFDLWKITLPHIPFGIGVNEGVSKIIFKDSESRQLSYPVVLMTQAQTTFNRGMRAIPNKILAYSQSQYIYILGSLVLYGVTAQVTMVSGGDSTNLDSELNVPSDYFPIMVEYIKQQLMFERMQPVDAANDGLDAIKTT